MYLVFAGIWGTDNRGWHSFQGSFDSHEQADDFVKLNKAKACWSWHQIVDAKNKKIIEQE